MVRSWRDAPVRTALQQSLNVVAVRLLSMVGVDKGAEVVKRFGLSNPMKRVLPSALGATRSVDRYGERLSTFQLGVASQTAPDSSSDRRRRQPAWKRTVNTESYKVITPYVAAQMQDMMRACTGGRRRLWATRNGQRMICGKTGR